MRAKDGKMRITDTYDVEGVLRAKLTIEYTFYKKNLFNSNMLHGFI